MAAGAGEHHQVGGDGGDRHGGGDRQHPPPAWPGRGGQQFRNPAAALTDALPWASGQVSCMVSRWKMASSIHDRYGGLLANKTKTPTAAISSPAHSATERRSS